MKIYGLERIKHEGEYHVAESLQKIDTKYLDGRISFGISSVIVPSQRGKEVEIDFVLIGKAGIFVLEVKDGIISIENGIWFTTNRKTGVSSKINPLRQSQDNYYALWEFLHSKGIKTKFGAQTGFYGCVFPEPKFLKSPDPGWVQEQFLDSRFIKDPSLHIKNLIDYKDARFSRSEISNEAIGEILKLLVPNYKSYITDITSAADDAIFILSEEQAEILKPLSSNKRMVIEGPPGSGKTVLAIEQLIQNEHEQIHTLFICHNRAIKNKVKAELIKRLGTPPMYIDTFTDYEAKLSRATYDYMVLDEAQDYMNDETFIELDERLNGGLGDGRFRMYLDLKQDLFSKSESSFLKELKERDDVLNYYLKYNYRNTSRINKFAKKYSTLDAGEIHNNPEGVNPEICSIPYKEEHVDYKKYTQDVVNKINELINNGTSSNDIMVVSLSSNEKSVLSDRNLNNIDNLNFKFVLGREYDWMINQSNTVVIGNVYDLKGLDSRVVILTDVFSRVDREKALLVGITRARARLIVFQGKSIRK